MRARLCLAAALVAIVSAGAATAQETVNLATISGRVFDQQGAAVPGAQVTARQTDTNVAVHAATDEQGRFRFPYLKIGPYELQVQLSGFRTATRRLVLSAGSAFDIPVRMEVAGL